MRTATSDRTTDAGSCAAEVYGPILTVSELAAKSGVPVASIHHYRRLGLLPEPIAVSPSRFRYDERHLDALVMIRMLREERRLPLSVIGELLPELLDHRAELAEGDWSTLVDDHQRRAEPNGASARLLAAARESVARNGYDAVNVGDICEAAGIAKGSFYRYFASKEDIFVAAARSTVEAVGDRLDERPHPRSEQEARQELEGALEPMIPLYLEVVTRELRGDARVHGVAAAIGDGLVARVVPRLWSHGLTALEIGRRVVDGALLGLLRPRLGIR
jgi:AcrR family transcriptional regulator